MANEIIGFGDLIPFSKLLWGASKIRQTTCDLKIEKKKRNNHKISVDITCVIYKYELFWSKINNNLFLESSNYISGHQDKCAKTAHDIRKTLD